MIRRAAPLARVGAARRPPPRPAPAHRPRPPRPPRRPPRVPPRPRWPGRCGARRTVTIVSAEQSWGAGCGRPGVGVAGPRVVRTRSRAPVRRHPGSHVPRLRKVRVGVAPDAFLLETFFLPPLFFLANSTGKIFMDLLKCAETTTLKSSIKIKEEYCSTATLGKLKDLRTNQSAIWL